MNNEKSVVDFKKAPKKKSNVLITIGSVVILVLSAIIFVGLPAMAPSGAEAGNYKPFGYYKKQAIEYKQNSLFATMLTSNLEQVEQSGQTLNNQTYYQVLEQSFADTVVRMAFSEKVQKSGYRVPDSAVNRVMRSYFSDENGNYSPKLYNETSDSTKIMLRKQVEEDLVFQQFYNDMFNVSLDGTAVFGLKTPSAEPAFVYNMNKPERSFEYVTFNLGAYPEDKIAEYANAHADLFKKISYSVITVATKSEAERIRTRILNNEITFEDAVTEYSNKNYSDANGILNRTYAYQLKTTVASDDDYNTVLALTGSDISAPLQTGAFYSIFRQINAPTNADTANKEVLDAVYSYIRGNEAGIIEDYFMAQAQSFVTNATVSSFDDACTAFNLTKEETSSFPLNYGDNSLMSPVYTEKAPFYQASTNENFLRSAFSLKQGAISEPILMGDAVVVFTLKEEIVEAEDAMSDFMQMYYAIYASSFDQSSASNSIMQSSDVVNNVLQVYLEDMLSNQ